MKMESSVWWEEVDSNGQHIDEHEIEFCVEFCADKHYGCDADGNRGRQVSWCEFHHIDWPVHINDAQRLEIEQLIDNEVETMEVYK